MSQSFDTGLYFPLIC